MRGEGSALSVEKLSHLPGVEKAAQAMTPSWQVGTQRQGGHLATVGGLSLGRIGAFTVPSEPELLPFCNFFLQPGI